MSTTKTIDQWFAELPPSPDKDWLIEGRRKAKDRNPELASIR